MRRNWFSPGVLIVIAGAAGCERTKSESPLSPSIAGPIAGVQISPPRLMEPQNGAQISAETQPVRLIVGNSASTGVRPLSYIFEVSSDERFGSTLFSQTGITPGDGGRTTFVMPQNLQADRRYYWRSRAQDGANAGDFSSVGNFNVYTPVLIQPPTPVEPADGATVARRPTLSVSNSSRTGPAGAMSYVFEIATDPTMANRVVAAEVGEGSGRTSYTTPDLNYSTRYYWRAQGTDPGHLSGWSVVRSLVTQAAPAAPTPPGGGGGGTPAPSALDEINLGSAVIVLGPAAVASWPQTATVTSTKAVDHELCINHTSLGRWPSTIFFGDPNTLVEGNQWVFANIGGRWYGGAADWYRPGQACKDVTASTIAADAFYDPRMEPLRSWRPRPGETFGVMSTTPARAWPDMRTLDQRTNVILIRWNGS